MQYLTMQIVDNRGPIVEVKFVRNIETEADVKALVEEASEWVKATFGPTGKAYFLNCYDNLSIPLKLVDALKNGFFTFNKNHSKSDVRYGGGVSTKAFWISTAIKEGVSSNFYNTREEGLEVLRTLAAQEARRGGGGAL